MLCHYETAFLQVSALLSLSNMITVPILNGGSCINIKTDYSVLSSKFYTTLTLFTTVIIGRFLFIISIL